MPPPMMMIFFCWQFLTDGKALEVRVAPCSPYGYTPLTELTALTRAYIVSNNE
jgi:hypothetical protein